MTVTNEQYAATQRELVEICERLRCLDLLGFIRHLNHVDENGDQEPALFKRARPTLRRVRTIARAANYLRDVLMQQENAIIRTEQTHASEPS